MPCTFDRSSVVTGLDASGMMSRMGIVWYWPVSAFSRAKSRSGGC